MQLKCDVRTIGDQIQCNENSEPSARVKIGTMMLDSLNTEEYFPTMDAQSRFWSTIVIRFFFWRLSVRFCPIDRPCPVKGAGGGVCWVV
ncbi:hypothetical protein T08_2047 [Trichinella sp. T8]|nr:hypothetical protein T08_2047 [Trichinella sp. T8]